MLLVGCVMYPNQVNKIADSDLGLRSTADLQKHPLIFLREQLFSFKSISTYLSSLSLFGIVHDGLNFGLSKLFQNALAYYGAFLAFAFQPIEFLLKELFALLRLLLAWDIHLVGEWRHAFMVMGLYFAVDLRGSYIARRLAGPAIASTAVIGLLVAR